jgi:hypothetical protein
MEQGDGWDGVATKPRIYCFGHGWALETRTAVQYVGTFEEACNALQQRNNTTAIRACLDIVEARMGQI